jgi:hypothetical protein
MKILISPETSRFIYDFDEIRRLLQEIEPSLKGFFDQLYLAAQLFERNGPYEEINGGYLLVLNNTKINSFKFELAFYLDSVDTSLGVTTTSRAVDCKKKQVADEHEKYVENALTKYSKNTFLLNVDDSRPETISIL